MLTSLLLLSLSLPASLFQRNARFRDAPALFSSNMWKSPLKPGKRGSLLSDTHGMSFLSRAWSWIPWRRSSMRSFFGSKTRSLSAPLRTQGPYLVVKFYDYDRIG
ncbi:hypothetical protein BDP55DRAFT_174403 [Colletotrichum godetiae]|uniref:Secreted protein n=1 Tax=Colletotrichum godetiae TaxID=1209918 RepID=A0AAJ0EX41_9PEZI|nr:uncharacterized protein BDP55DRAFT_174403 [Colletotrichum godetiae]KAK1674844.1 hypothetical protein BDP55DRAFT_174403 [Colletotrichum godetiae]